MADDDLDGSEIEYIENMVKVLNSSSLDEDTLEQKGRNFFVHVLTILSPSPLPEKKQKNIKTMEREEICFTNMYYKIILMNAT